MVKVLILVGVALVVLMVWAAIEQQVEWDKFAKEHHCRIVGKIDSTSTTGVGLGSDGKIAAVPVFIPGKTGWQCDDGITYWR